MVRLVAMGDNVVDCYVANGVMYPGGNTLNVATYVSRFGGQAAYVGRVANDPAGRLIRSALSAEGVDISHLLVSDEGTTAYCIIGHQNGDRVFLAFDLGVSVFTPGADELDFIAGFDAVHVGRSSGLDGMLQAVASRTRLSYDFSTSRDAAHIQAVAPLCYFAASSGGDLAEKDALELQRQLLDAGAEWALVTRGKAGALLSNKDMVYSVSAKSVDVIDTLGAGDTFAARTLYGLLAGEEPTQLLEAAAQASADTCRHFGALGHGVPIEIDANIDEMVP